MYTETDGEDVAKVVSVHEYCVCARRPYLISRVRYLSRIRPVAILQRS
jgi:hypothetical protein